MYIMFDQNWMKNIEGVLLKTVCLYWILTPRREHNSDKACYEDANYPISFILTWYMEGE